jgi:hypothetical protein
MTGPFGIRLGYQVCPRFSLEPLQGSRTDRILIASAKKKDLVISNRVRQVHDSALISHDSSCSMPFNRPVEVEPKLANRPATVLRTLCVWQLRDTRLGVRHVPLHLAGWEKEGAYVSDRTCERCSSELLDPWARLQDFARDLGREGG